MNLTVERLTLASHCGWWLRPELDATMTPPQAGTQQLRALREVVRYCHLKIDIDWRKTAAMYNLAGPAMDRVRAWHKAYSESAIASEPWAPGVRIAYRPDSEAARAFDEPVAAPGEIVAIVDLQQVEDYAAAFVSLRTGVATPGEMLEIRAIALAFARLHEVPRVMSTLVRVSESGVSRLSHMYDTEELKATADELRTGVASSDQPVPGWYCRGLNCPAFVACPRV